MFRPVLITPPVGRPVSVVEAKAHSVIDFSEDDTLVETYIEAATSHLDGFRGVLGRCILTQTWAVERAGLDKTFVLPVPDVQSVAITYDDKDGAEQTIASTTLHPVAEGTKVRIVDDIGGVQLADTDTPVRVQFTAGFGAMQDVPQDIKLIIMMHMAQSYDDRHGAMEQKPRSLMNSLIAKWRWVTQ